MTARQIVLDLPWPPSGNHAWRKGRSARTGRARWYKSDRYKVYLRQVQAIVIVSRANRQLAGEIAMRIEWTPPDRRRRDLSNVIKTLEDALTKAGVWLDDSQVAQRTEIRLPPARPGRARVVIDEIGG